MKSILDHEMVRRRAAVSHTATLGGLLTLLVSVLLPLFKPNLATPATILMFIGFAIAAVGVYLANAWVKKPRPEETLDRALKSLNDVYRLYHYTSPCDHLLLFPGGLVVLETINLDGHFSYSQGKWKQKMTMNRAMRFIFDERLGDPIVRAQRDCQQIKDKLENKVGGGVSIPVNPVVIFIHPAAELEIAEAPIPVVTPKRLEKVIPKNQKGMQADLYRQIQAILDQAAEAKNRKI